MEIASIFRMSWMKYLLKLCFLLPLEKWLNINWFSKGILSLNFFNAARNFLCSYLWWNSSICVLNLFLRKLLHQNFFLSLQSHLKICLMEHLNFFLLSLDIKRNFSMPSTYANGFAHSHFVLVGAIRMWRNHTKIKFNSGGGNWSSMLRNCYKKVALSFIKRVCDLIHKNHSLLKSRPLKV